MGMYPCTDIPWHVSTWVHVYLGTGVPGDRCNWVPPVPGYRCTWLQVYLGTGVPGYRCTWVQVYLGTGVPGYRCTQVHLYTGGVPGYTSCVRALPATISNVCITIPSPATEDSAATVE